MTKQHKNELLGCLACLGLLLLGLVLWSQQGTEPQQVDVPGPATEEVRPDELVQDGPFAEGKELPAALFGYRPNDNETRKFLRQLPKPTIREAGPDLFKNRGPPQDTFLYRPLYKAHLEKFGTPWVCRSQGIGDCVSWGFAHGCDIHLAVLWAEGISADWKPAATESIYGGSRVEARGVKTGGWSDGSYGSAAAKWLLEHGIIFRQEYEGHDLTEYSARKAKDWGNYGNGGQNDNGKLDATAKLNPVRSVALVTTFEEAAAAIESGYPVPVCSMVGFSNRRDEDGFAWAQGQWAHCMCFIAVRHGERPGLLCLNSWGTNWISGPKWPEDMPEGSFWVDVATVNRMLGQRDSFAISGHDGFPFQELDHGGWVDAQPPRDNGQPQQPEYALAL